jgi:predicted hydrolase (HD superfamily)
MTREEALQIVKKYLTNQNLIKHSLAAEAAMQGIYDRLSQNTDQYSEIDREKWGLTGLMHDADYEMAKGQPEIHGLLLFEKEPGVIPPDIEHAIKAHNYEYTKIMPETPMDWAIACCDQLTGLIVAGALIHPDRKLASITVDFIMKRFNEKSFAKGASRDAIILCEEKLGIPLNEFILIVLTAMQGIHEDLGL